MIDWFGVNWPEVSAFLNAVCAVPVGILVVLLQQAYTWYQFRNPRTKQKEIKKRSARFVTIGCVCILGIYALFFMLAVVLAQNDESDDSSEPESVVIIELSELQEVTRRYRDGTYYSMINSATNSPDGKRTMRYDNGNTYEGEWNMGTLWTHGI